MTKQCHWQLHESRPVPGNKRGRKSVSYYELWAHFLFSYFAPQFRKFDLENVLLQHCLYWGGRTDWMIHSYSLPKKKKTLKFVVNDIINIMMSLNPTHYSTLFVSMKRKHVVATWSLLLIIFCSCCISCKWLRVRSAKILLLAFWGITTYIGTFFIYSKCDGRPL